MREVKFEKGAEDVRVFARLSTLIGSLKNGRRYVITVKEDRNRRSLDANAYCWHLINELGNALRMDKEAVYLEMLKSYGQSEIFSIRSNVDVKGYFKYYDTIGKGYANGREFTHYKVYKGSSEYDTREMSILIDGVIEECRAQGIETATPAELEQIKAAWAA